MKQARKALRALKGVIKLQAIIRGEAVRHQVSSSLKNFPSDARNQVAEQERSSHTVEERYRNDQIMQFPKQQKLDEKELNLQPKSYSERTWDCSLHSREDIEAIWLRKQEAIAKRERMKQYSFSQKERKTGQMVEEPVHGKEFGRESCRTLRQWLHKETCDCEVLYKPEVPSNMITMKREWQEEEEGLSPQISIPRKSFSHVKRSSLGDEHSMPNSPAFPSYMALTESSKAKARSMSTPRQRTGFLDIYSNPIEHHKEDSYFCCPNHGATSTSNENSEVSQQRLQSAKCHYYHFKT